MTACKPNCCSQKAATCQNCENTMLALQAAKDRIAQLEAIIARVRHSHPGAF